MVPGDHLKWNCWSFREEGHSIFTFPFHQLTQRLYFAYKYYLHQIETNPDMAKNVEERSEWRLDPKNHTPRIFHDLAAGVLGNGFTTKGGGNGGQLHRGGIVSMR